MASEFKLNKEQMRAVAEMALEMVQNGGQERFSLPSPAAPRASAVPVPAGGSSSWAAAATPYEQIVSSSRAVAAPAAQRAPSKPLQVGAYAPYGSFAASAAPWSS